MKNTDILMAGAARADSTPPVGTFLYGYAPNFASTSLHDKLDVTALALKQGEVLVILLSVAIGDFQTKLASELREKIGAECGVLPEYVILSATHTHSAPNVAGIDGWGDIDRPYVDGILLPAMLKAAKEAVKKLAPAVFAVGTVESKVGVNRRELKIDGSIKLGQNPWGAYDPTMTCIAIRNSETKEGILNLIHYGCHGTSAGFNPVITRDWSGVMLDTLEAKTGTMSAFINGAIGDVGPRLTNGGTCGDINLMTELGEVAAEDAKTAWERRGEYVSGKLSVHRGRVEIPYKELLPPEYAKAKLSQYKNPEALTNVEALEYAYFKSVCHIYEKGIPEHDTHHRYDQTIVTLGDIAFIPFPYEFFSEISMRHRKHSPYGYTLCLSNTNGYEAYLPTEDQLVRGGYEVRLFQYCDAYTLVNNADQIILEENLRILNNK